MATAFLAREAPGQTLQATALVHEAYLRLNHDHLKREGSTGGSGESTWADSSGQRRENLGWRNRAHFFASAAETMRRILIDAARRKKRQKRGGDFQRVALEALNLESHSLSDELLDLDEALCRLESKDKMKADIVKLRYFAGLTVEETADVLGISEPTVKRHWSYARAWLKRETTGTHTQGEV
jgi:RNA polymerase sigma factor (sigma-70 family)